MTTLLPQETIDRLPSMDRDALDALEVGVVGVDVEEQRRLALRYRFHRRLFQPRRQRGQFAGELQQQRQLVLALDVGEVSNHLGQRRGQAHNEPGSSPATMGTRTVLPHSVHDPS